MPDEPRYASSAPVVKVDGQRQPDVARDLLRLDVEESIDGLRTLHLHVIGSAARERPNTDVVEYLDGSVFDFGKRIEVSLGPPGNEKIVFTGTVSGIEVSFEEGDVPHVTVLAEDDLMKLRMTQRSATYERKSDADIASEIAKEHGLQADVAADGPSYDVVQQLHQSDLAFLRERAKRVAAEVWSSDGKLHFATRDRRTGTTVKLVRGGNLVAVEACADLAHQCSSVVVSGYDASTRSAIDERAPGSDVEAETNGGRTGPRTLTNALGELPAQRIDAVPVSTDEAKAWAKAELLRRARRFVTVRGSTSGTPEMVVGSRATLERCGKPFDGDGYYVTRIHHAYDVATGFRTRFHAERATVNER